MSGFWEYLDGWVEETRGDPRKPWREGWPEGHLGRFIDRFTDSAWADVIELDNYANIQFSMTVRLGNCLLDCLPEGWAFGKPLPEYENHVEYGDTLMLDGMDGDDFGVYFVWRTRSGDVVRRSRVIHVPSVPLPEQQWRLYNELRGSVDPAVALATAQAALADPRGLPTDAALAQ